MKSVTCALFLLVAASDALAQEKQLLFEGPKGVSDADRMKAAKALAARCVAFGLSDVSGDTFTRTPNTPKWIRLLSKKGFSAGAIDQVAFLAGFPCKSVELRLERFRTEAEKVEYPEGEKAPKGCTWSKIRTWQPKDEPFPHYAMTMKDEEFLFLDKPVIDAAGKWKIHRHEGGDLFGFERPAGIFLMFKGTVAGAMYRQIVPNPEKPGKTMLPLHLFIDGIEFSTDGGMMAWRDLQEKKAEVPDLAIWEFPGLTPESALGRLMEQPLPFAMKRVE